MRRCFHMILFVAFACTVMQGQTLDGSEPTGTNKSAGSRKVIDGTDRPLASSTNAHKRSLERGFVLNMLSDQKVFWTSPSRFRLGDVSWLVPFGIVTGGLIASDTSIEKALPTSASLINHSRTFADLGTASLAGAAGALYLWGKRAHDDHAQETGVLSAEALANSVVSLELIKMGTGRQRPLEGSGAGQFWRGGSSFPSEHSAAAWSLASVIAHEYPGTLTVLLAYGTASGVSVSRLLGRNHFAADVFVGAALGWYMGRQVYRARHDPEVGGAEWGTFERSRETWKPSEMGSTYVPLDSWIYPALDRLAALGLVRTAIAGQRPWTRMECARQIQEAQEHLGHDDDREAVVRLVDSLADELRGEMALLDGGRNVGAQVDSLYMRWTGIGGPPLRDGYHFAQTIANDFGRPYAEGFNSIAGFTGHAEAGPVAMFVQGEYQHAPSAPALPLSARQTIQQVDLYLPAPPAGLLPPGVPAPSADRFRLLNSYVAVNIHNWQLSFGKQTLWWGPERTGPMALSDNAEPVTMLRMNQTSPIRLPGPFKMMGPVRWEVFFGQLEGQEIILGPAGYVGQYGQPLRRQPYFHGQKLSFKPTENLEIGFSRETTFSGGPYPLTWGAFGDSLFSTGNTIAGSASKPGDRRSFLDFSYRIPKLRDWLTFYADGFSEDEFSPIAYWDKSAWTAGLYMPRIPKLPQVDLRVEGVFTDLPGSGAETSLGYFYFNATWRSGYTNEGNLLGSWIGRQGQGAQTWVTYHLSPRSFIEANFRHQKVSHEFLPGGGSLTDGGVRTAYWVRPEWGISGTFQWERWLFPVIARTEQRNVTASVQITFQPRNWGKHQVSGEDTDRRR